MNLTPLFPFVPRPFYSVVGIDFGLKVRNAAVEPFDTGLLEAAELTDFVTLRVSEKYPNC